MTLDFAPYPGYEARVARVEAWYTAALREWLLHGGGQHALNVLNAELERRMVLAAMPEDIVISMTVNPTAQPAAQQRRRWQLPLMRRLVSTT